MEDSPAINVASLPHHDLNLSFPISVLYGTSFDEKLFVKDARKTIGRFVIEKKSLFELLDQRWRIC